MSDQQDGKKFLKESGSVCKDVFCSFVSRLGVHCEKYSIPVILTGIFIMGGILYVGGKGLSIGTEYFIEGFLRGYHGNQLATAGLAEKDGESNLNLKEAWNCGSESDSWELWIGDVNRSVKDDTHYFLPKNTYEAVFKYSGDISASTTCTFKFVPRGERAINYAVSVYGVYQVVVGDNDFWTISLRASDSVGSPLDPIKESRTGKERPRLLSSIKNGSEVKITISQSWLDDEQYEVKALVTYAPDLYGNVGQETESFSWKFSPSPRLKLQPLDLGIGLIRGKGDTSDIGVSFISPIPKKESPEKTL